MSCYSRIRRQQLMQEAEGYIDLVMCLSDSSTLSREQRIRMSNRAIRTLDKLDGEQLNHPRVLYFRGMAFRLMERYQDAIGPFNRAREMEPENMHINLAAGWCYKRIGRIDLAIAALEEAIEFNCEEAILYYNLACYWSLASNVGLTLIHLQKAFEIDSNYRDRVADEPDFDEFREHPEFLALTGVIV